jgi:hypothetical protein
MDRSSLIKKINRGIRTALAGRVASKDFQRKRVYDFHDSIKEPLLEEYACHQLVRKLDRHWQMHTVDLYPAKCIYKEKDWIVAEGWALDKRYAAIQIPKLMATQSIVAHEHAHGIVECFLNYEKTSIQDQGHGALWVGVFIWNYAYLLEKPYEFFEDLLKPFKIVTVDEETIKEFRSLFINKYS